MILEDNDKFGIIETLEENCKLTRLKFKLEDQFIFLIIGINAVAYLLMYLSHTTEILSSIIILTTSPITIYYCYRIRQVNKKIKETQSIIDAYYSRYGI